MYVSGVRDLTSSPLHAIDVSSSAAMASPRRHAHRRSNRRSDGVRRRRRRLDARTGNHLYYAWMALLRDNFSYESADMGSPNTDVLDHYDVRRAPSVGMCALALIIFFLVYLFLAERCLAALARSRR